MKRIVILLLLLPLLLVGADYNFALELFQEGLYEEAIKEFEAVINYEPTGQAAQSALFQIAESYRLQEKWQLAEESYSRLIRAYPETAEPDRNQYYLALMQYKQGDYVNAGREFEALINGYPGSIYSQKSIYEYLASIYAQKDYDQVIQISDKLVSSYSENRAVPSLLLLQARADFATGRSESGLAILNEISTKYPDSDARWEMLDLQLELLQKNQGRQALIAELKKILSGSVPRQYEKELRQQLVNVYLAEKASNSAMKELEIMVDKYDNADDLDEIILLYLQTALKTGDYSKVTGSRSRFDKVFKESDKLAAYELAIGWGHYYQQEYAASERIAAQVLKSSSDAVWQEANYLAGKTAEKNRHYKQAIEFWQIVLPYNPPNAVQILYDMASIYYKQFANYNSAINYYRQILTNYNDEHYQVLAVLGIAGCYRALGNYEEALRQLNSINSADIQDTELQKQIEETREYVREFELEDYETAFSELLLSLSSYLLHNNRDLLQQNLAEIMAYELKDYTQGAQLLAENTPETGYRKALILLKLAAKSGKQQLAGISTDGLQNKDEILLKVNSIVYNLGEALPQSRRDEIKIKKLYESSGITPGILSLMDTYVSAYADGEARNEFILILARHYEQEGDTLKLVQSWQDLAMDKRIDAGEFHETKIRLAEYYYETGNNAAALAIYKEHKDKITYMQPQVMYHKSRLEIESGEVISGMADLKFLIDNQISFTASDEALQYLLATFRKASNHEAAIKYSAYLPQNRRDSSYYQALAQDYLALNKEEEAKKSLMYIEDKDDSVLLTLADLQYKTSDMTMALYSYGVLQDKGVDEPVIYKRSADIYFAQEDFAQAVKQYELYLSKADNNDPDYILAVQNYIICHYRIKNRPKAEELKKEYKSLLTDNAINNTALAEAIYYIDIDSKKSEKLFNKLIEKDLSVDLMINTYFWRGVLYLKYQNIAKAKADFVTVAAAKNADLANQARFKLGLINFSEENFAESLENYNYVIENDDSGRLALDAAQNFAKVCRTIEEWDKAIAAYELILEKWGDTGLEAQTLFDIAFCYYRDKNYDRSVEMFQKVMPLLEDRNLLAEAQYWIGMSYFENDEYEKAVTELLKVGYSYENYTQWAASAELQAGEAYQKLLKPAKAKRIYERVKEKYGAASQWGELAQQRLNEI